MNVRMIALTVGAAALVGACGGMELRNAETAAPSGDAFSKALHGEYLALAKNEYSEGDYGDSDLFAMRAVAAAGGAPRIPEIVSARKQTPKGAKALEAARTRLIQAYGRGARKSNPAQAARAQAKYECWAQELEENFQPDDIDACRIDFFKALAQLGGGPAPAARAERVAAPPAASKPSPLTFLVYFDFNGAGLTARASSVVATAADVIKDSKPSVVSVIGHTDRAGSSDYNSTLAERRANVVADALMKAGVSGRLMSIGALGENALAVNTADGARESGNRRVEISLRY